MDASFSLQNPHFIMDDDSVISSTSDASSSDSMASSSSDLSEDASSFTSSTPERLAVSPLYQMSSLMEQLPFKRGLSKHFQDEITQELCWWIGQPQIIHTQCCIQDHLKEKFKEFLCFTHFQKE
ncbi:hypothetical protein MRB53_006483 [Persea americana]|uniref:Uncharacterized protein n=1 Tax=Persea americana TaxID=3435 RepID=A0ACC2MH33_PERAE|nr:hypothetical protein MRB53_006483 [Persea americana]